MKLQRKELEILYYLGSEQQRRWSDCADAQADLRLCCLHMTWTGFLITWLKWRDHDVKTIIIILNWVFTFDYFLGLFQNFWGHTNNPLLQGNGLFFLNFSTSCSHRASQPLYHNITTSKHKVKFSAISSKILLLCIISRSCLIWACTVCPDLPVQKLKIITVNYHLNGGIDGKNGLYPVIHSNTTVPNDQ